MDQKSYPKQAIGSSDLVGLRILCISSKRNSKILYSIKVVSSSNTRRNIKRVYKHKQLTKSIVAEIKRELDGGCYFD